MKRPRSSHALPFLLVLALAGCGRKAAEPRDAATFPPARASGRDVEFPLGNPQFNTVQTVEAQGFRQSEQRFTGRLTWSEDHTSRAFSPVGGRVERILAEVGQRVKKGDDLALMRSPDFGQAQADYRKATSDLAQFDRTLTRVRTLREHGAASQKDLESAQADFDRATAEKQRAELNLQLLGKVGGDFNDVFHVVAPIDGVVVDRNANLGQQVRSDIILANSAQVAAPMFTLTDPTKLWVQLDVPEAELNKLRPGQPVELRTPAYPGRVFPGRLDVIGAFLDPLTRVAHARASVDNPDNLLKAEMYVGVVVKDLLASETDVELPARAVLFLDGRYHVLVETAPRKFTRREVTLERENGGDTVVVRGVAPGERVVSRGSLLVNDLLPEPAEDTAANTNAPASAAAEAAATPKPL